MRGGRPPMGGSEPLIMGEGNFPDDMGERPMMNKEQNVEDIQKKAAEAKKKKIKKIKNDKKQSNLILSRQNMERK